MGPASENARTGDVMTKDLSTLNGRTVDYSTRTGSPLPVEELLPVPVATVGLRSFVFVRNRGSPCARARAQPLTMVSTTSIAVN
jgi:hypothetical protein